MPQPGHHDPVAWRTPGRVVVNAYRKRGAGQKWCGKSWARIYRHRMALGLEPCRWCQGRSGSPRITFDHIIPLVKGGSWAMTNVTIMCFPCNQGKGDKDRPKLVSLAAEEAAADPEFRWSQFPQQWDPLWHPPDTPRPERPWQYPREPELVEAL